MERRAGREVKRIEPAPEHHVMSSQPEESGHTCL